MLKPQPAKALIVLRGDTQKNVAEAISYRRSTLNLALNGQIRPSDRLRQRLADYLEADPAALFTDTAGTAE